MTTKTQAKPARPETGPTRQDLQVAYQVHTLAQLLYGQMASAYPWMHVPPPMPMSPMSPTAMPVSPVNLQAGHYAMPTAGQGYDPSMAPTVPSWTHSCATGWYDPAGYAGHATYPWIGTGFFGPDLIPR